VTETPARTALVLAAILAAGACSREPGAAAASARGLARYAENPCVRDLKARDVADILGPSGVTVKEVASNPEACRFEGPANTAMTLSLRSGEEVEPFWKLTVTRNGDRMIPLTGVGDAALRLPDGAEVMARKGSLSCQADLVGADVILARKSINGSADVLAQKLGGLCNKLFAARRA